MDDRERAREAVDRLSDEYPSVTSLEYGDPFELLVATVLSAQCTDERVNAVTEELFERYGGPEDLAGADRDELVEDVRPTGYFNQKADYLLEMSRAVVERHGGKVPDTMEELTELHGVGRKTANVVLSEAFGVHEGIAVDTHVKRVSRRLGLTNHSSAEAVERDLLEVVPEEERWSFNKLLVAHGREVCGARETLCEECSLRDLCDYP